ncbi:hypothetical protein KIPB_008289, partial [Kipferlia bialata]|eukprot:g8289.t1
MPRNVNKDDVYGGRKVRRRSSATKVGLGDYLRLNADSGIRSLLSQYGESDILFADEVLKINRKHKSQLRRLMITDGAVYNMDQSLKVKRRIPLDHVTGVSVSSLDDNTFILHVRGEHDYLMVSSRKSEVCVCICQGYGRLTGGVLPVSVTNSITCRLKRAPGD